MNVVIVEDNVDFAQLLGDILEIMGCTTHVAYTALRGLQLVQEVLPHIVFCDPNLPDEMNGLGFARAMRSNPAMKHIPLVAVTGYTSETDKNAAVEAGFNVVYPKPVKFADLTKALNTFAIAPLPR